MNLMLFIPRLDAQLNPTLPRRLGASRTDTGNLVVDDHQRTTVSGLYAAGDVVTDLHQLSVAFGHAAIAATNIHNQLPAIAKGPSARSPELALRVTGSTVFV